MNRVIPILITLDIHCHSKNEKEIPIYFEELTKFFDAMSIKATFFFPAETAEKFSSCVDMALRGGHEIGCHGLTHTLQEQYDLMSYEHQRAILHEAKERMENVTRQEVISFRAPVFKINGDTIRALEKNGFRADSSVNSQRLGILSSDVTNTGWLYSPRRPYHPSFRNPFRRGESSLWEIPLSGLILPFTSNTGIALGGIFMRLFFRLLYIESAVTKSQIVYMFHPRDIYPKRIKSRYRFEWRHLLPSKIRGFQIRNIVYHGKDPEKIARENCALLRTMRDSRNIEFVTLKRMSGMLASQARQ